MNLSTKEKEAYLMLARLSIRKAIGLEVEEGDWPLLPGDRRGGVLVSLYVKDDLRGCMGTFADHRLLAKNIRDMAPMAATQDHRFTSIKISEMEQLCIELSVLTPKRRVQDIDEIQVGRHGIFLEKDGARGTLLPQVALRQSWSAEEFVEFCARNKAGLEPGGWREADLYVYEALVFRST